MLMGFYHTVIAFKNDYYVMFFQKFCQLPKQKQVFFEKCFDSFFSICYSY